MTPEERARCALDGFPAQAERQFFEARIAQQIKEAVWEERNACAWIAAEYSQSETLQKVQAELTTSGMDPDQFSLAAWIGLLITRRPEP